MLRVQLIVCCVHAECYTSRERVCPHMADLAARAARFREVTGSVRPPAGRLPARRSPARAVGVCCLLNTDAGTPRPPAHWQLTRKTATSLADRSFHVADGSAPEASFSRRGGLTLWGVIGACRYVNGRTLPKSRYYGGVASRVFAVTLWWAQVAQFYGGHRSPLVH